MKYMSTFALWVVYAISTNAFAHDVQIGKSNYIEKYSQKSPKDLAICIAKNWADKTQKPVFSQVTVANDVGIDILFPEKKPGKFFARIKKETNSRGSSVLLGPVDSLNHSVLPSDLGVDSCL